MRKSWIQVDGKFIPKEEYHGNNVRGPNMHVMPDIEPFVSPIDGSVISSRPHLKAHNKKHGVTNTADYSPQFLEKRAKERHLKATGQDAASKADRIRLLKAATE
jgi:hypothetical protein